MTLENFKHNYQSMLNRQPNEFSASYLSGNVNPSFTIELPKRRQSNAWKLEMLLGILFAIYIVGIILIIIAIKHKLEKPLTQEDEEFLNKFTDRSTNTNYDECKQSINKHFNLKELQLGFLMAEDYINGARYNSLFYRELPEKNGFILSPFALHKGELILKHKNGKITHHPFFFILNDYNLDTTAIALTKENITKIEILTNDKIITDHTGGLAGALVGASIGALTGSGALGGAAIGSTMGRGSETRVERIEQTVIFLNNGIQLLFNGNAAYTYYTGYFQQHSSNNIQA